MFLHIFVADIALNSNKLISKQCIGLKLSVLNEEDATEYSIFTGHEKENLLFKFQQTIQIPISKKLLARSTQNERLEREKLLSNSHLTDHTMIFRLKFTLYAIYRHNTSTSSEQSVCLGSGTLMTKLNDETISKTIILQESQQSINQHLQGPESFHVIGKLYVTMFYHSSSIEIGDNPSFLYDSKHPHPHGTATDKKKSVNEYSFLLSRKLRNKESDQMVTFDHLLESRLSKDAQWYQETNVVNKTKPKSSSSPSRRTSSSSIFLSPRSQQHKKASVAGTRTTADPSSSEPPKLRKTHMSVGYVKNEWPEPNNKTTDMEKRIYQLQLMNEKKLKLIAQIAKELEQKYSKKEKETSSSSAHLGSSIRSQQQKKEELEREQQEKLLRKQLKHQANEVKNLELQLTKLRLESALAYSTQPPVESKHSQRHSFSSKNAPFDQFGGRSSRSSSNVNRVDASSNLLYRLVKDVSREQQRTSSSSGIGMMNIEMMTKKNKKQKKSTAVSDVSRKLNENDALQRLISTEAIKQKLNKELKSTAMSHTTSSAIRATSPAKPILVSPSPSKKDYPKFVKSSILNSLSSKEKEKEREKEREREKQEKAAAKIRRQQSFMSQSNFSAAATTALKKKQSKQKSKKHVYDESVAGGGGHGESSYYADAGADDYWLNYHRHDMDSSPSNIIRVSVQKLQQQQERHQQAQRLREQQNDMRTKSVRRQEEDAQIRGYLDNSDEEDIDDSADWVTHGYGQQKHHHGKMRERYPEQEIESPQKEYHSSDFDQEHESYSYFPQEEEFSHDNVLFNNFVATNARNQKATANVHGMEAYTRDTSAGMKSVGQKSSSGGMVQDPVFESYSDIEDDNEVDMEAHSIGSEGDDDLHSAHDKSDEDSTDARQEMVDEDFEDPDDDSLLKQEAGTESFKVPGFLQTLVLGADHDQQAKGNSTVAGQASSSSHENLQQSGRHSPMNRTEVASPVIHPHQDDEFSDEDEDIMRSHLTKKNTMANVQSQHPIHNQNQQNNTLHNVGQQARPKKTLILDVDGSSEDERQVKNDDNHEDDDDDDEGRQMFRDLMDGISDDDTVENGIETASAVKSLGMIGKRKSEDSLTPTPRSSQGKSFCQDEIKKDADKEYWISQMNVPQPSSSTSVSTSADIMSTTRQNTVKFSQPTIVHRSANDRIRSQFEKNRQATVALSSGNSSSNRPNAPVSISQNDEKEKRVHMLSSHKEVPLTVVRQESKDSSEIKLSTEARVNFVINNNQKGIRDDDMYLPEEEDLSGNYNHWGGKVTKDRSGDRTNKVLKQLEKNRQYQAKPSGSTSSGKEINNCPPSDANPFTDIKDELPISPSLTLSSPTSSKKEPQQGKSSKLNHEAPNTTESVNMMSPGFSSIRAEWGDIANSLGKLEERWNSGTFVVKSTSASSASDRAKISSSQSSQDHDDDSNDGIGNERQQDLQDLVDNVLQESYQNRAKVSKSNSPHRSIDADKEEFRKFLEEVESEDEDSSFSYSKELKDHHLSKQLGILDSSDSEKDF